MIEAGTAGADSSMVNDHASPLEVACHPRGLLPVFVLAVTESPPAAHLWLAIAGSCATSAIRIASSVVGSCGPSRRAVILSLTPR